MIFREAGDEYGEGHVLANLGLAYSGWQQLERAIALYRDALVHFRAIGDHYEEGQALSKLGYRSLHGSYAAVKAKAELVAATPIPARAWPLALASSDHDAPARRVADRIVRFAEAVSRENVVASTDCGLGGRVHPQIAWAKLGTPSRAPNWPRASSGARAAVRSG